MSEDPVTVDELAEKADEYLHEAHPHRKNTKR